MSCARSFAVSCVSSWDRFQASPNSLGKPSRDLLIVSSLNPTVTGAGPAGPVAEGVVRTGTYHQGFPFKLEIGEGASVDVAPAAGRSRAALVRNKRRPHVEV